MRTITFYSYKGGVGRSLALSNIAKRLSEFGKKVCILDFDLEAPGLQYKFKGDYTHHEIDNGIVDYIYDYAYLKSTPKNIRDYSIELYPPNIYIKPIYLIPAGNIEEDSYWKKLSMINWSEMFYEEKSQGVAFFLDLKDKIQQEFKPDFLLIDSRTGITDIAGITLKLLADEVVVLAANNEENIFGSKKIIKSLLNNSTSLFEKTPNVTFVLTRLPFTDSPEDKVKEYHLLDFLKRDFQLHLNIQEFNILVIHSDRRLEINERALVIDQFEENSVSIVNDYLTLFNKLMVGHLDQNEIEKFESKKRAEKEFSKALQTRELGTRIQYLKEAIKHDNTKYRYFVERANIHYANKEFDKSLYDFNEAHKLKKEDPYIIFAIGNTYFQIKEYKNAIKEYDKAINLYEDERFYINKAMVLDILGKHDDAFDLNNKILKEINPNNDRALNGRANYYRVNGKLKDAYIDIYKAIELNSNEPIYFGTLAEIFITEGKTEDFYFNLTLALNKGIKTESLNSARDVYGKVRKENRFIDLMNKYKIDLDELFAKPI